MQATEDRFREDECIPRQAMAGFWLRDDLVFRRWRCQWLASGTVGQTACVPVSQRSRARSHRVSRVLNTQMGQLGQLGHPGLGHCHGIRPSVISWFSWDDILGRAGHLRPPDAQRRAGETHHHCDEIRYRLQVVGKILKIIRDPSRPAFRTEHGKSVWEMTRDFTISHQIVSWREELSGGIVRLFTFRL